MIRMPLWVELDPVNHVAFVRGFNAKQAIQTAGDERPQWLRNRRAWVTRERFTADLVAMAEHDGRRVYYSEIGGVR